MTAKENFDASDDSATNLLLSTLTATSTTMVICAGMKHGPETDPEHVGLLHSHAERIADSNELGMHFWVRAYFQGNRSLMQANL